MQQRSPCFLAWLKLRCGRPALPCPLRCRSLVVPLAVGPSCSCSAPALSGASRRTYSLLRRQRFSASSVRKRRCMVDCCACALFDACARTVDVDARNRL